MTTIRNLMGAGTPGAQATAICGSHGGAIVSAGTGSIAAATLLPHDDNYLSPAANLDSYVLPTTAQNSQLGDTIYCYNPNATAAVIFAGTGESVNSAASASLAQNKMIIFKRMSPTLWGYFVTA